MMIIMMTMQIQSKTLPLVAVEAARLYWSHKFQDGQSGVEEAAERTPIEG